MTLHRVRGSVVSLVCVESYTHLTGLSLHSNERGQPLAEGGGKAEMAGLGRYGPAWKPGCPLNRFPPHVILEEKD